MMGSATGPLPIAGIGTVQFFSFFFLSITVHFIGKDTGPHQDNVQLLTNAVRARNLTMGLYFSQFEW